MTNIEIRNRPLRLKLSRFWGNVLSSAISFRAALAVKAPRGGEGCFTVAETTGKFLKVLFRAVPNLERLHGGESDQCR